MRLYCVIGLLLLRAASGGAQNNPLVAPDATVARVAGGFAFVEGPVADLDGNLYFTDIPNARIHRWSPGEGIVTVREDSGGPTGCASTSKAGC